MLVFVGISERIAKNSRDITLLAASVFASGILVSSPIYQDMSKTTRQRGHLIDLGADGMSLKAILNDCGWRAWNEFFCPSIGRGDFLYEPSSSSFPRGALQCLFVSKMYLVMHVNLLLSSKRIAFT